MTSRPHLLERTAAVLASGTLLAFALVGWVRPAAAHDVPDEMVFQAHVVTDAQVLRVPLRVPLAWLMGYDFPLRGPGYLDLEDTAALDAALGLAAADVAADIALFEDGSRLQPTLVAWRLSLPSDRSFADPREALANIAGPPLPTGTNLFWNQGFLDLSFVYAIEDPQAAFSVEIVPEALAERLHLLTTFVAPDGTARTYDLIGALGRAELNPGLGHLLRRFVVAGFTSLLRWEHVLFVALLAVALGRRPARALRPVVTFGVVSGLVVLVTGATAGVEGQFTGVLVGTTVAASLLVVAVGNCLARDLRHRWLTAAACAAPHGLLLAEGLEGILQFRDPGDLVPLVAYVLGALAAVAVVFAATLGSGWLVTRHEGARRHGTVAASLLVGYVGWRDVLERGDVLRDMPPPPVDAGTVLGLARWVTVIALVAAALWFASELLADRRAGADSADPPVRRTPTSASEEAPASTREAPREAPTASEEASTVAASATGGAPGRHGNGSHP